MLTFTLVPNPNTTETKDANWKLFVYWCSSRWVFGVLLSCTSKYVVICNTEALYLLKCAPWKSARIGTLYCTQRPRLWPTTMQSYFILHSAFATTTNNYVHQCTQCLRLRPTTMCIVHRFRLIFQALVPVVAKLNALCTRSGLQLTF